MNRAYLFDFDGTLVDTMEGFADIAARVIHEYHPKMNFEEARLRYIETSGVPFCQQMEIIFPGHIDNDKVVKEFEETKIKGFFEQKFEENVRETITALRARGDMVIVSSGNFPDLIKEFVKREKLDFDLVLGFDEENNFEKGKPHFDFVMKKFNLKKEDITFVGDSLKDADKAYENKIDFIGVCGIFNEDDFQKRYKDIKTIKDLRELLAV